MKNKILLLIGIVPAILFSCKPTPCADVLIKKDTTDELERTNNLFAFVGEKIDMKRFPTSVDSLAYNVLSRYKVIQRIYGCYPGDTIAFTSYAYDEWPEFGRFKNVLLYVRKEEMGYYHDHYLYDDVYMTKSGKWAGPFETEDAEHYSELNIIPERMEFTDSVTFPLNPVLKHWSMPRPDYPHPFYWTVGDKAIAQYGIYIENVFSVKKEWIAREDAFIHKA